MTTQQSTESTLSEDERIRIRQEMRYAMLVLKETHPVEKQRSFIAKVLGYLNNGFILLLLGSLITSVLVPRFQREYERRMRQSASMQECLSQFLVYSNSVQEEYYRILPVTLEVDIDKDTYTHLLNDISTIKLKRYNAYAKVAALAIVFRRDKIYEKSAVENALHDYAVNVNVISSQIDNWLRDLYCTPTERSKSPCLNPDLFFNPRAEYLKIKKFSEELGNERLERVTELMAKQIDNPN